MAHRHPRPRPPPTPDLFLFVPSLGFKAVPRLGSNSPPPHFEHRLKKTRARVLFPLLHAMASSPSEENDPEKLSPTNYLETLAKELADVAGKQEDSAADSSNGGKVGTMFKTRKGLLFKRRSVTSSEEAGACDASFPPPTPAAAAAASPVSTQIVYMAIGQQSVGSLRQHGSPLAEAVLGTKDTAATLGRDLVKRKVTTEELGEWGVFTREQWCSLKWPVVDAGGCITSYVCVFRSSTGGVDAAEATSLESARAALTKLALIVAPILAEQADQEDATAAAAPAASGRKSFLGRRLSMRASLTRPRRSSLRQVSESTIKMVEMMLQRELETSNAISGTARRDLNAIAGTELENLQKTAQYPDAPRRLVHDTLFGAQASLCNLIAAYTGPRAIVRCKALDRKFAAGLSGVQLDLSELPDISPSQLLAISQGSMSPSDVVSVSLGFACDGNVLGHLLQKAVDDEDDDEEEDEDDDGGGVQKSARIPSTALRVLQCGLFEGKPDLIMGSEAFLWLEKISLDGSRHFAGPLSCNSLFWMANARHRDKYALSLNGCGALALPADATELASYWYESSSNPSLAVLNLSDLQCVTGSAEVFSKLTKLTELRLNGCSGLSGYLSAFAGLHQLTVLDLCGCVDFEGSLAMLGSLKQLRVLNLQGDTMRRCHAITGTLSDVTEFPELNHLNLNFCSLVTGDLEDLVGLLGLNFLGISSTPVTGGCNSIAHLPLTSIEIFDCPGVHGVGVFKQQKGSGCRVYGRK